MSAREGGSPVRAASLNVGDRVVFIADADAHHAADDPLYQPVVPQGATGLIVKVADRYVRVRLDDTARFPDPVRLWEADAFPDDDTATLQSIRKVD